MNKTDIPPNRLIDEKSPYLKQHAYNPVMWFPWCEEAFSLAKASNKPIFLSIGYSTCHWCHVMEKETFENMEVAEYLNRNYISIKVDREERPDVDSIYMSVCQKLTGSGGWPLSIFMDADKKPFFAGTYFPKDAYRGVPGFSNIIGQLKNLWDTDKTRIDKVSEEIINSLESKEMNEKVISANVVEKARDKLRENFDKTYGGFFGSPKFPTPQNLLFLLRADETPDLVVSTLDNMYKGGIYDHIGYGFHRYSTDKKWLVPHFEKMLYDNALMTMVYAETYMTTQETRHKKVAEKILTYLLRDMQSPEGAFYSAEDADSCGIEGEFYVWKRLEILEILGVTDGERFCQRYNISDDGNFEGKNILNLIGKNIETNDQDFFNECLDNLFTEREKRIHPSKDKKILTSWNGLMIAALSICGKAFDSDSYILQAEKTAGFILETMMPNNILKASICENEVKYDAYLEDYSFFIWGLIELYQACYKEIYLEKAVLLMDTLIENFWDTKSSGFFLYSKNSEKMIIRPKEIYDGAMPSGNSVSIYNLIRLARLTGHHEYEHKANNMLSLFAEDIENMPIAHCFCLVSLWYLNNKPKDIVFVCDEIADVRPMLKILNKKFRPNISSILVTNENKNISNVAPFTKDYNRDNKLCKAYICENFKCTPPMDSLEKFEEYLKK